MRKLFRIIAHAEGYSYLLLFAVTMPLKYGLGYSEPNKIIGMLHGVLFISFITLSIIFGIKQKWNVKIYIVSFITSLLPFGTFWFDKKYIK